MLDVLSNPGVIALITTVLGGVGLKITESWLGKAKSRSDADLQYRTELRNDIDRLRQQLVESENEERRLEAEVERWRNAWYDLREEKQKVVTDLTLVMNRIKELEPRDDDGI